MINHVRIRFWLLWGLGVIFGLLLLALSEGWLGFLWYFTSEILAAIVNVKRVLFSN